MANDRLYLRCRCGAEWFVAKHYSSGWWRDDRHDAPPTLRDFLDAHIECFTYEADGAGQFGLFHEAAPGEDRPHGPMLPLSEATP